jgi:nucleotide-binding universal stress UspA family protein
VASASYSFVRFTGGAVAPWLAGKLAEHISPATPFVVGAAAVAVAAAVLIAGRRTLVAAREQALAQATGAPAPAAPAPAPVLVALDGSRAVDAIAAAAVRAARARRAPVEVVHVRETDVVDGATAELESDEEARAALASYVRGIAGEGVEVVGEVLEAIGTHDDAARAVLRRAQASGARLLIVGAPDGAPHLGRRSVASIVVDEADCSVLVVRD